MSKTLQKKQKIVGKTAQFYKKIKKFRKNTKKNDYVTLI